LRQLVQQNPALLQPFLQQLAATNPQLFELINRNSQQFMEYLTEGSNVDLGALGDDDMEGDEGAGAGGNVVQVSAAERDAIQRLEAMGFDRQMVLQAFIACDRNEELACVVLV
jgi:UV excision repair protein RAD23